LPNNISLFFLTKANIKVKYNNKLKFIMADSFSRFAVITFEAFIDMNFLLFLDTQSQMQK